MNNQADRAEAIRAARGILIAMAASLAIWSVIALYAVSAAGPR